MKADVQQIQSEYDAIKGTGRTTFGPGRFKFGPDYYLLKTLEKYPNYFTKEGRYEVQTEYADFPDLGNLNLDVFVSVLIFLRDYPEPKPEYFRDDIIVKYFEDLLPKEKQGERKRLIIRMKAQFLKYLRAITSFRQEREAIFQEKREELEEELSQEYELVQEEEEYEDEYETDEE
jgi:hypothetical protein